MPFTGLLPGNNDLRADVRYQGSLHYRRLGLVPITDGYCVVIDGQALIPDSTLEMACNHLDAVGYWLASE
jgi:hypothetical protein